MHEITRFLPGIGAGRTSSPRCHWPEEGYLPALIMAIQLLTDVELGYDRSDTHLVAERSEWATPTRMAQVPCDPAMRRYAAAIGHDLRTEQIPW